ncbi:MAG: protease Do [Verrucomicrobiales bacterium]|nr:protease Do [Verrucomicrobiales bacterium]
MNRGTLPSIFLRCLAAVAVPFLAASCQHEPTPESVKPIYAKIDRKRPASLEFWKTKSIQGREALDYGSRVSAMLAPTDITISLRTVRTADGGATVKCGFQGKPGKSYGFGSAVPISKDGYFLTAAHCVGQKGSTIQILAKTASPPVTLSLARVVWRSDETNPAEPDLAILHAPIKPEISVRIASPGLLKTGTPILTSGYGSFKKSWAGGRIQSITAPQTAPTGVTWRELTHSAPFTPGDSGGPILSEDGELVGINSQIVLTTPGWLPFGLGSFGYDRGICFVPDPVWLDSIIQRDRTSRDRKHNIKK